MCVWLSLATIGLTIPAVLTIGLITGYEVHLGLDEVQTVLLILTLFVSALTFGGARTNVLQGIVHLLLFIVYLALMLGQPAKAWAVFARCSGNKVNRT